MTFPRPLKTHKISIFDPLGCTRPFGDILGSIVSNSHFGKRSGARVMGIFMFHVSSHIPNIGYSEVHGEEYGGIWDI